MWQWWRSGRGLLFGLIGALALVRYGVAPTYQPAHFGRAYGVRGVFIVLSLCWGVVVDGNRPDAADLTGAGLALAGVGLIMYWPR